MSTSSAALLGAIIGSVISLLGLLIQQWFQNKRDRVRVASELAIKDYQNDLEIAKNTEGGRDVAPISAYVIYHAMILEALSKGTINSEEIKKITKKRDAILSAFPGAPEE